jgi:hypothetical protein
MRRDQLDTVEPSVAISLPSSRRAERTAHLNHLMLPHPDSAAIGHRS